MSLFWFCFAVSWMVVYAAFVSALAAGLSRLPTKTPRPLPNPPPFMTVLTAARNEAENIEACLRALADQEYPADRFEIVAVDDHSTDDTFKIASAFAESRPGVRVLRLSDQGAEASGKQHALDYGIQQSRGEIIAGVDADCCPPSGWLQALARRFEPETGVLVGFSMLDEPNDNAPLFVKAQSLELLALFAAFAGCIGLKRPVACTGNNLAYRRAVYDALGGFAQMGETVAEDNMFLQWASRRTDWKIEAVFDREAAVLTKPMPDARSFFQQRLRWASNSLENRFFAVWFMTLAYGAYLLAPLGLAAAFLGYAPLWFAGALLALKLTPEFVVLWIGLRRFERHDLWVYWPFAVALHTAYALAAGLVGLGGRASWKGRVHRGQRRRPI